MAVKSEIKIGALLRNADGVASSTVTSPVTLRRQVRGQEILVRLTPPDSQTLQKVAEQGFTGEDKTTRNLTQQLRLRLLSDDDPGTKMDHVDEHGIITWENGHKSDIGERNLEYYVDLQNEFYFKQMTEEDFIQFDTDWLENHANDRW